MRRNIINRAANCANAGKSDVIKAALVLHAGAQVSSVKSPIASDYPGDAMVEEGKATWISKLE